MPPEITNSTDGSQSSCYILFVALGDIGGLHIAAVNEYAHSAIERLALGEREPLAVLGLRAAGAKRTVVACAPLMRVRDQ